eukprot:12403341-Karenia_brevis.AAC.1
MDFQHPGTDDKDADKLNILTVKDTKSKAVFCYPCNSKSPNAEVAARIIEDIEILGYNRVAIRCDNEPAVKKLQQIIIESREQNTIPQNSPKYSSQSNGAVERAIQSVTGHIRVTKFALEQRIKTKIPADWPVLQWIVVFVGMMLTCHEVGQDGRTAYYRLHGRQASIAVAEFGEQVFYRVPRTKSNRLRKLETSWFPGTWIGINRRTHEHLVAAEDGSVVMARSIRRRPLVDRWKIEQIKGIRGTPTCPNPSNTADGEIRNPEDPIRIEIETDGSEVPIPEGIPDDPALRRMKIDRSIFEEIGYTKGCYGCRAIRTNAKNPQAHSEACRAR